MNDLGPNAADTSPGSKPQGLAKMTVLRSWIWPLAPVVLLPVAAFLPQPGPLQPRVGAANLVREADLITPTNGGYRIVEFAGGEWRKFNPVYAVSIQEQQHQEVYRSPGWGLRYGVPLGFFHRKANWSYQLTAHRFGNWKSEADGPFSLADSEIPKLRPLVVQELDHRQAGRGQLLSHLLHDGEAAPDTLLCWQNVVVLFAWLSLPLGLIGLLARLMVSGSPP